MKLRNELCTFFFWLLVKKFTLNKHKHNDIHTHASLRWLFHCLLIIIVYLIIYCLFCWWFSALYWLIICLLFYCLYLLFINYILSHSLFAILLTHYYSINQSPHSLILIHTLKCSFARLFVIHSSFFQVFTFILLILILPLSFFNELFSTPFVVDLLLLPPSMIATIIVAFVPTCNLLD